MKPRPGPIEVSRSRSKSPSRIFRPTTPRSIPAHILQPRTFETTKLVEPTRNALHETTKLVEPIKNALRERKKVMSMSGVLVEPKTPPGLPPRLPNTLKRLTVKRIKDKL